jgi:hypothetical protein
LSQKYANRLDLDKLSVFQETDSSNPMYIQLSGFPEIFTYGKHYGTLSIIDSLDSRYYLRDGSRLQIEVKDINGTVIYSDVTDEFISDSLNGAIVFYIWIKEDPLRTYKNIKNGTGTITVVSELTNVPIQWRNKPNHRCVYPIEIRTDLPNTSPILFQDINHIQLSSSFSESIDLDTGDSNYKRSYLNISASNLHTYGGKVDRVELSYREARSQNNEYEILTTYPLSSSVYELSDTGSVKGLNPISDLQKFPTPKDIRRNGNIDFRLRFLNSNGEFAQDINQNNVDVEITGSITGFTGSAFILETADNLITGSGGLFFGKSLSDGIKLDYKDTGTGDFKDEPTLEFTPVKSGTEQKPFAFTEKGSFLNDIVTNTITGSQLGSILAATNSTLSHSFWSVIIGGTGSFMEKQPASTIIGGIGHKMAGTGNETIYSNISAVGGNAIVGGIKNTISSSYASGWVFRNTIVGGGLNKIINPHASSTANTIVGGNNNEISGGAYNGIFGGDSNRIHGRSSNVLEYPNAGTIIGGKQNEIRARYDEGQGIIGGSGNFIDQHKNAWIIGMNDKAATAADTVYVQNLDVAGTGSFGRLETTVVSASVIYSSGSNIFGDAINDTHLFNGHITASGNISASGNLYGNNLYIYENAYFNHTTAGAATENIFSVAHQDSDKFVVQANGAVGIGNSSPPKTLTIEGTISASQDLYIKDDAYLSTNTLNSFTGIGTTSPSKKLTVYGDISASGDFYKGTNKLVLSSQTGSFVQNSQTSSLLVRNSETGSFVQNSQTSSLLVRNSETGSLRITDKILVGGASGSVDGITVEGSISASGQLHLGNPTHAIGGFTVELGSPTASIKTAGNNLGKGYGEIITMTPSTTVAGLVYHLKGNTTWANADRDSSVTAENLLGIAMGTHANTNGMLLRGFAQVSQSGQLSVGQKVYIHDNGIVTGSVTDYPSGDFVRVIGHCVDAGNTNGSASIYFNPSNDWIEIA